MIGDGSSFQPRPLYNMPVTPSRRRDVPESLNPVPYSIPLSPHKVGQFIQIAPRGWLRSFGFPEYQERHHDSKCEAQTSQAEMVTALDGM